MRKLIIAGILASLGSTLLATPASASFDRHFAVLAKPIAFHETADGFRFRDKLLEPGNRDNRVGRDRGKCRQIGPRRQKCRFLVHLNGEIGGFGDIRARGGLGLRHDSRLNVMRGNHDFNGGAGKMLISDTGTSTLRFHFDLVR